MFEQLQAALVGALVLILPPLALLVVAKLRNMKADLDAAFSKIRAHEDVMQIKTTQDPKTGAQHVSASPRPLVQSPSSKPPQGLGEGKGAS